MSSLPGRLPGRRPWPLTREAWQSLLDEIERLVGDVRRATEERVDEDDPIQLSVAHASRRLDTLRAVADAVEIVDEPGVVVIGRRVRLREDDGTIESYALVFPGEGDPLQGWVSADSPLGEALLGARAGDTVEVEAPAGTWSVAVVEVS